MLSLTAFLTSTGIVAIAEIGDKTQLLALLLAARFRKPVPILGGILIATLINHALAAWAGGWLASLVGAQLRHWIVGACFLGAAIWALIPDRADEDDKFADAGPFVATAIAFFIAEIGDKTQFATASLAARFDALLPVVAGTTLGMMIADAPAVLLGDRAAGWLNFNIARYVAAAAFAAMGLLALAGIEMG